MSDEKPVVMKVGNWGQSREPKKKDLTQAEVDHGVKVALSTTDLDARIAWAVLSGLQDAKLAGPWQQAGNDADWFERKTHDGKLVAATWWERDSKGEIQGAKGRVGRGHWHEVYLRDEAPFPGENEPSDPRVREFPTVAVAMIYMDTQLQNLGWALVPPFGTLPPDE